MGKPRVITLVTGSLKSARLASYLTSSSTKYISRFYAAENQYLPDEVDISVYDDSVGEL